MKFASFSKIVDIPHLDGAPDEGFRHGVSNPVEAVDGYFVYGARGTGNLGYKIGYSGGFTFTPFLPTDAGYFDGATNHYDRYKYLSAPAALTLAGKSYFAQAVCNQASPGPRTHSLVIWASDGSGNYAVAGVNNAAYLNYSGAMAILADGKYAIALVAAADAAPTAFHVFDTIAGTCVEYATALRSIATDGETFYATRDNAGTLEIVTVNPASGAVAVINTVSTAIMSGIEGWIVRRSDKWLMMTRTAKVYRMASITSTPVLVADLSNGGAHQVPHGYRQKWGDSPNAFSFTYGPSERGFVAYTVDGNFYETFVLNSNGRSADGVVVCGTTVMPFLNSTNAADDDYVFASNGVIEDQDTNDIGIPHSHALSHGVVLDPSGSYPVIYAPMRLAADGSVYTISETEERNVSLLLYSNVALGNGVVTLPIIENTIYSRLRIIMNTPSYAGATYTHQIALSAAANGSMFAYPIVTLPATTISTTGVTFFDIGPDMVYGYLLPRRIQLTLTITGLVATTAALQIGVGLARA